ncbi:SDR family oxidoreductase [Aliikangiella maris]|uniref:SDR family oxidoreductase n=2 Tax=Aliikangiella maris TaxID=3162458 RepID=A0ABV2BRL3_9GAMM
MTTTILITGTAKRIGKAIAHTFARHGCNIAIHYLHSKREALSLQQEVQQNYTVESEIFSADLLQLSDINHLVDDTLYRFGRLDHLVNNASIFYPTPIEQLSENDLQNFLMVNYRAPQNLMRQAAPHLARHKGSIINLIDIYANAGLSEHTAYVSSKAALFAQTQAMARELAPSVRVNGISPGAILWPDLSDTQPTTAQSAIENTEQDAKAKEKREQIIQNSALKKLGSAENIAATALFLAFDADYITGQTIRVDGGRRDYI